MNSKPQHFDPKDFAPLNSNTNGFYAKICGGSVPADCAQGALAIGSLASHNGNVNAVKTAFSIFNKMVAMNASKQPKTKDTVMYIGLRDAIENGNMRGDAVTHIANHVIAEDWGCIVADTNLMGSVTENLLTKVAGVVVIVTNGSHWSVKCSKEPLHITKAMEYAKRFYMVNEQWECANCKKKNSPDTSVCMSCDVSWGDIPETKSNDPGWDCTFCKAHNALVNEFCERCYLSPDSSMSVTPWECVSCTFVNNKNFNVCELCERRIMSPDIEASVTPWECMSCTFVNNKNFNVCELCQDRKATVIS